MSIALAALALGAAPLLGQHPQPPVAPGGYAYQLHLPTGYGADPKARWPLLIFLHGSGERGDDLAKAKAYGPPKIADRDPGFPFVLVTPQLLAMMIGTPLLLDALLESTLATLNVTPRALSYRLSRAARQLAVVAARTPFLRRSRRRGTGDGHCLRPQDSRCAFTVTARHRAAGSQLKWPATALAAGACGDDLSNWGL